MTRALSFAGAVQSIERQRSFGGEGGGLRCSRRSLASGPLSPPVRRGRSTPSRRTRRRRSRSRRSPARRGSRRSGGHPEIAERGSDGGAADRRRHAADGREGLQPRRQRAQRDRREIPDASDGVPRRAHHARETYFRSNQYLSARRVFNEIVRSRGEARFAAYQSKALGRLVDVALRIKDYSSLDDIFASMSEVPPAAIGSGLAYAKGKGSTRRRILPAPRRRSAGSIPRASTTIRRSTSSA